MNSAPYFDRLGEAYAVVDGLPDHQVTLDIEQISVGPDIQIGVHQGEYRAPTDWDALTLTPDIWLSLCPAYIEIIPPLVENWEAYGIELFWHLDGRITSRYEMAMAHLFNLSGEQAEHLFGMRGDDEEDTRTDKQVFLERILAFLRDNEQEVTVGTGHLTRDELLEHGISLPADEGDARRESAELPETVTETVGAKTPPDVHTGFGVTALESERPGAETMDTEASGAMVDPIVHQQSTK